MDSKRIQPAMGDIAPALQGDVAGQSRHPSGGGDASRRRKPWLALLFGIFLPTVAFAYVGRLGVFLLAYGVYFALVFVLGRTGLLQTLWGVWSMSAAGIVLFLASVLVPWMLARRERSWRPRWYNRWYLYVLIVVVVHVPAAMLVLNRDAWLGYATYRIPSTSMAPTVDRGDFVVADTRESTLASVGIGDVVVVESDQRPGELLLRRIVAVGGQHVGIGDDGVRVDGVLQPRDHLQGSDMMEARWMNYPDVDLEADELYLMGDNRGNSFDSRTTGPLSRSRVRARVTAIWWPPGSARLGAIRTR